MTASSNFDETAREWQAVAAQLDNVVEAGAKESLADGRSGLYGRIQRTLAARGMASGEERARGNPQSNTAPGVDIPLAEKRAWDIEEVGDGFAFRPANPRVAEKVLTQEFGEEARTSNPEATVTFMGTNGWVTKKAGDLEARDDRYSGWFRQSIVNWNNDNEAAIQVSDELQERLRRILTS